MSITLRERSLLVFDVSEVTKDDRLIVTFTDGDEAVYIWFDGRKWLIDEKRAPEEIWETATQLHRQDLRRLSTEAMRLFGKVVLRVHDTGYLTLQPGEPLVILYHFPLQTRSTWKNYGTSPIKDVQVSTNDEVRRMVEA